MSRASQGAPAKRKARHDEPADVGTPVTVDRLSGDSLRGIVRERYTYDEHAAPAHVLVESSETMVNVATDRVSIARGSNADVVRSLVEADTNV
ncbi:hypothetical protein DVK00_20445 [Haloarcula sp. Atlit-47R]|uniref:hypothetical protein n=1 Tax=Haloarcula sp. Atlit-47R TaxID=2282132 RepID=UPI000EF1FFF9|nr:hypothetical protein [Haloarcula sp. Atlit-47R]RLM41265.1 hypothetical protein DVK00_20445 [Haloarcula sp. Atlit-47R]